MSSGGSGGHKRLAVLAAVEGSQSWRPGEAMMVRGCPRSWQNTDFFGDRLCLWLRLALILTIAGGPWSSMAQFGPDHALAGSWVLHGGLGSGWPKLALVWPGAAGPSLAELKF